MIHDDGKFGEVEVWDLARGFTMYNVQKITNPKKPKT